MKKILALVIAFLFALSLFACSTPTGDNADNATTPTGNNAGTTTNPTGSNSDTTTTPTDGNTDNGEISLFGIWKVIPPDGNSFPPLYLVLNEDGTAGWGAKLDNLEPHIWYECDDYDAEEGQMELSREDNRGYGDMFYLTEDGKIYMEVNLRVGDNTYDHIYFEKQ